MHLLFENVTKELISLWEGDFRAKTLTGDEEGQIRADYVIPGSKWRDIDRDVRASNRTVPTQLADRARSIRTRDRWTAESYPHFLLFLGPIVMKDRLADKYYKHFLQLSEISRNITRTEIQAEYLCGLKRKLAQWVRDFEK